MTSSGHPPRIYTSSLYSEKIEYEECDEEEDGDGSIAGSDHCLLGEAERADFHYRSP